MMPQKAKEPNSQLLSVYRLKVCKDKEKGMRGECGGSPSGFKPERARLQNLAIYRAHAYYQGTRVHFFVH